MTLDELAADAARELREAGQRARFSSQAPEATRRLPAGIRRRTAWAYMAAGFAVAMAIGSVTWLLVQGEIPRRSVAPEPSMTAVDRWGLAGVDLPDTAEAIGVVFEAMPPEVGGFPGGGSGGEHLVSYGQAGDEGSSLFVEEGEHRIGPDGKPRSQAEALAEMADAPELEIIGAMLEGETVWLYGSHTGEDGTEHFLVWGESSGDWLFFFNGWSVGDLDALVEAFIETLKTTPAGAPSGLPGTSPPAPPEAAATLPETATTGPPDTATPTTLDAAGLMEWHGELTSRFTEVDAAIDAFVLPPGTEPCEWEAGACDPATPAGQLAALAQEHSEILEEIDTVLDQMDQAGVPYPVECSAAGFDPNLPAQPELPEPVATTRRAVFEAALICDWEALSGWAGAEAVAEWRRWEMIPAAPAPMIHLAETLALSWGVAEDEGTVVAYWWPSATVTDSWEDISEEERTALLRIYGDVVKEQFAEWGFINYRLSITPQGEWEGFWAGT